jgi:hypothetical protein
MMEMKKMVAAVAAVNQYLAEESAATRLAAPPLAAPSVWAAAGREQLMNHRQLVALRLWK